jgi:hypothetical protein
LSVLRSIPQTLARVRVPTLATPDRLVGPVSDPDGNELLHVRQLEGEHAQEVRNAHDRAFRQQRCLSGCLTCRLLQRMCAHSQAGRSMRGRLTRHLPSGAARAP